MTKTWEQFERDAVAYLQQTFGAYATFTLEGVSDSTSSDIYVITKTGLSFHIEAKHTPAQSGQFVLLPDEKTRSFKYSKGNKSRINPFSEKIIAHMDASFDLFLQAGTSGVPIQFDGAKQLFISWVVNYYRNKDVRYIITKGYRILPMGDLGKHFDVTATYRIKKSGSS